MTNDTVVQVLNNDFSNSKKIITIVLSKLSKHYIREEVCNSHWGNNKLFVHKFKLVDYHVGTQNCLASIENIPMHPIMTDKPLFLTICGQFGPLKVEIFFTYQLMQKWDSFSTIPYVYAFVENDEFLN